MWIFLSAFSILSDRSTLSRLEGSLRLATPMAAPKTHSGFGNAILQGECLLESSPRSRTSRRAVNNSREKREGGQSNHSLSSNLSSRKSQYLAVLSSQSQSQRYSWSRCTNSGAFHACFGVGHRTRKIMWHEGREPGTKDSANRALARQR